VIEQVVKHPPGRFSPHRACGQEPRHVRTSGSAISEPASFGAIGSRHFLECKCGARTARHATLAEAEAAWGTDYAQLPLPLRRPRRRAAA